MAACIIPESAWLLAVDLSCCSCCCCSSNETCRVLRRLTLEDAAAASHTFVTLMGDKVGPRRALIEAEGQRFTLEQLDI